VDFEEIPLLANTQESKLRLMTLGSMHFCSRTNTCLIFRHLESSSLYPPPPPPALPLPLAPPPPTPPLPSLLPPLVIVISEN